MSTAALTYPFINDNDELTKEFLGKVSTATTETQPAFRSRVVPTMDRRSVGVGLLRNLHPVVFDPDNPEHRKAWATFYVSGKWTMHFILEQPWDSVPQMIQDKMLAQLVMDIGPEKVKPAPVRLVHDQVVPNNGDAA